jgi:hypothetical protein
MSHFIDYELPCLEKATREQVWQDTITRIIPIYLKE